MHKIKYSPSEEKILKLIPKNGSRVSSEELLKLFYGRKQRPFFARNVIIGTLRSLARKMEKNHDPYRLHKSERKGPKPIDFWIEPK